MRIFQVSASRPKIVTAWPFHVGTLYSVITHLSNLIWCVGAVPLFAVIRANLADEGILRL
jgi:hypothetical protein